MFAVSAMACLNTGRAAATGYILLAINGVPTADTHSSTENEKGGTANVRALKLMRLFRLTKMLRLARIKQVSGISHDSF